MKALSLWQPHALAIGLELKPWETRGWSTDYRGPVAIHAAKRSWTDAGPWHSTARQILAEYVARRGPVPWIFGAVICTADLVSCVRTSELRGRIPAEHEFWGDFSDGEDGKGRYAFKLENVKMLAEPVYVRGMQGWFEVDLGAEERVAAASMQLGLFEMFGQLSVPGPADAQQVLPAGSQRDDDAAAAPAPDGAMDLFDLGVAGADVAQEADEGVLFPDLQDGADRRSRVVGQAVNEPAVAKHEVDHDAHAPVTPSTSVALDPAAYLWMSPDVIERRAYYLYAARWWRGEAQRNGKGRDSETHRYADNQELLANDIERRPEYYQRKPVNITDWNWFQASGVPA